MYLFFLLIGIREKIVDLAEKNLLERTLVRALIGAEFSSNVLTTCSCPDRAAQ